jgi:hypothetical protein
MNEQERQHYFCFPRIVGILDMIVLNCKVEFELKKELEWRKWRKLMNLARSEDVELRLHLGLNLTPARELHTRHPINYFLGHKKSTLFITLPLPVPHQITNKRTISQSSQRS